MNGLDGGFDIAICSEHDRGRHIAGIAQALQKTEAVKSRHIEVGNDDVGGKFGKLHQGVLAVAGRSRRSYPMRKPSRRDRCAGWLRRLR